MKTNIINIGSSQGIILPSTLLKQLNLTNRSAVRLEIVNGTIIIKPESRQGWAKAAAQIHHAGNDQVMKEDAVNDFDKNEWTW